ncbi:hypothetical protein GQX73_g6402 [Xylaria multiplex]|uniref:BZIP domain-containing protein n=1 Tax=Xylaria multiplex TaxID=323545 RepID=A0A7C8N5N7_9PEZI|nr:hypothetical protein GQX73_g6402 [Xylaria multiplex]
MPRKVRPPADPAQNRENQQRSRARRRAYLAGLEARVREFEAREVYATMEMQRAAREVAWSNERLVELLATRGVSRAQVDEFLRRCKEERNRGAAVEKPAISSPGIPLDSASVQTELTECEGIENRNYACADGQTRDTDAGMGTAVDGNGINICGEISKRSPDADAGQRALITPCDAAASIIAGFQGHGDVSHARKVLGCSDVTNCHVKNTRLFQLMDEAGCTT